MTSVPPANAGKPRFSRAVAWRLMLSFALLAMLPLLAGVFGWLSTRLIQDPLERVTEITQAVGIHDRSFRRWSRSLNTLFAQPERFETRAGYDESFEFIQQALAGMRGNVELLVGNPYIEGAGGLLPQQQLIEEGLLKSLELTERRIAAGEKKRDLAERIGVEARGIAETTALAEAGSTAVRRQLDALRYSASTLGILARDASVLRQSDEVMMRRSEFAARLRSTLQDLTRLPEVGYRRELGEDFERIFNLGIGPGGLFDTADEELLLRSQEVSERNAVRANGLRLVEMLGEIDRVSDEQTRSLLHSAEAALQRTDLALIAVGGVSSLLALLVMFFYLRNNVLRRLVGLTKVTKKLTRGDLEQPVRIEGSDELSELANALEAFRHSALRLRENERVLAERSEELEYLNKELDQFAYVASHDLKAPMRAIDNLASFLREDLGDAAQGDSARHLDMMQGRIRRLDALLDSLLVYSRAGRLQAPPENVNLRELIDNCVQIVAPQDGQVELTGSFGQVSTWKTPLEQVLRNLIDNAFKHNDAEHGLVSIDCEVVAGELRITVADNGPGIDPKFHERIFGMFQTLQARDKIEGSGMGLAILKKLVDTYGGEITVDSDPEAGRGTRFHVRWPTDAVLPSSANSDFDPQALASIARSG